MCRNWSLNRNPLSLACAYGSLAARFSIAYLAKTLGYIGVIGAQGDDGICSKFLEGSDTAQPSSQQVSAVAAQGRSFCVTKQNPND